MTNFQSIQSRLGQATERAQAILDLQRRVGGEESLSKVFQAIADMKAEAQEDVRIMQAEMLALLRQSS